MDGAPTLWKKLRALTKRFGVTIVCILDIFHVMDYLWDAARCVHGSNDKAAEAFVTDRLRRILNGDVGRVIGGLRQMLTKGKFSSTKRQTLNKVINYLDRKKQLMGRVPASAGHFCASDSGPPWHDILSVKNVKGFM